jgi:hypothetical protein
MVDMRVAVQSKLVARSDEGTPETAICLASSSGAEMVRKFNTGNRDLSQTCRLVQLDWPSTRGIMIRIGEYVTDSLVLKAGDGPMLFKVFRHAYEVYEKCHAAQAKDRERFHAFIDGMIGFASQALAPIVLDDANGVRRWFPAGGRPLLPWLMHDVAGSVRLMRRGDGADAQPCEVEVVYAALHDYVLTKGDAAILAEVEDGR